MLSAKKNALILLFLCGWLAGRLQAGVSREVQQEYRQRYEGKALFLGIPVHGVRTVVAVRSGGATPERSLEPLRFKVGEQVRIQSLSFGDTEIRFKISSVEGGQTSELVFRFPASLEEEFSSRSQFESSLQTAFSEGRRYSDLDQSKKDYIRNQLQQTIQDMMNGTTADRDFVMNALAESLPAYQTAVNELKNLRGNVKDLSYKLSGEQTKSRQLESKLVDQTSELNRLRSMSDSLKSDLTAVNASSNSANTELRQLRQEHTEITASVRRLQKGLNLSADASKSLSRQVEDLMVAALKNKGQGDQVSNRLKTSELELEKKKSDLQAQLKANDQLTSENTRLQENIKLLSSRGDQLGQRYLSLQKEKVQLENFVRAVQALRSRIVAEKVEKNRVFRTTELLLRDTQVAVLETEYPTHLGVGDRGDIRIRFTSASINYVKLTEEEKRILSSLGDKLIVRCELRDLGDGARVVTGTKELTQTVPERSSGEWSWTLESTRIADFNPVLLTSLVNASRDSVPVVHNQLRVESMNLARMIRNFLSPIPLGIGAVMGMVLFASIQALRRFGGRRRRRPLGRSSPHAPAGRERIEL